MEPTIYKPSISKGAGIYKAGAAGGGGGDSPDIPEEYKEQYKQVNYIQSTHYFYAQFNNVDFSNDDIIKLKYGVVYLRDGSVGLISSRTGLNHSGIYVQDIEINNAYHPNNMMFRYVSSDKNKMVSGLTGVVQNSEIELVVNYPYMTKDGVLVGTLESGATSRTAKTICLFRHDSGDKSGTALGIVEIIDKVTFKTKYKFIPSKNKNTNQYGWFETINSIWGGNDNLLPWSPT